ncbi:MAG: hypothetical protein RMA76_15235 [Deltaproteobacteria bacterium]
MTKRDDTARAHIDRASEALRQRPTNVDPVRRAKLLANIEAARGARPALPWMKWSLATGLAVAGVAAAVVVLTPSAPKAPLAMTSKSGSGTIAFDYQAAYVDRATPKLSTGRATLVMPNVPPPRDPVRLETPHATVELEDGRATVVVVDGVTRLEVIAGRATWIVAGRREVVEAGVGVATRTTVASREPRRTDAIASNESSGDAAPGGAEENVNADEAGAVGTNDTTHAANMDTVEASGSRRAASRARAPAGRGAPAEVPGADATAPRAPAGRSARAEAPGADAAAPRAPAGRSARAEAPVADAATPRASAGRSAPAEAPKADAKTARAGRVASAKAPQETAAREATTNDEDKTSLDADAPGALARAAAPAKAPPTAAKTEEDRAKVDAARALVRRDAQQAERLAEEVLEQAPIPEVEASALMVVADVRRRANDPAVAARLYARVVELPEGKKLHEEALLRNAELLTELGRVDGALAALNRAKRLSARALWPERLALEIGLVARSDTSAAAALAKRHADVGGAAMGRARLEIAKQLADEAPTKALELLDAVDRLGGSRATLTEAKALRKKIEDS